jgi:hypothetical protein
MERDMADKVHIPEDEYAVKLTQDISGGLGNYPKDTVLRGLSYSSFNTLTCTGLAKRVKSTASGDIVDFAEPEAANAGGAPKGKAATK